MPEEFEKEDGDVLEEKRIYEDTEKTIELIITTWPNTFKEARNPNKVVGRRTDLPLVGL